MGGTLTTDKIMKKWLSMKSFMKLQEVLLMVCFVQIDLKCSRNSSKSMSKAYQHVRYRKHFTVGPGSVMNRRHEIDMELVDQK